MDNSVKNRTVSHAGKVLSKVKSGKGNSDSIHKSDSISMLSASDKVAIINKARNAVFNQKFCDQNKDFCGFIPLSLLPDPIQDNSKPHDFDHLEMHKRLIEDGRPNFCDLQLTVPSKLNHEKFLPLFGKLLGLANTFLRKIWFPFRH